MVRFPSPVPILVALMLLCGFGGKAAAGETSEERDLSAQFGPYTGCFVLYDGAHEHWIRYHPDECGVRKTPCSTFKIANTLIALETGVASGPDFRLKWDGTHHQIEVWNRDHSLRSAFSVSCVWYFQELARRVGLEPYQKFLPAIGYGNADVSGGLTQFWLQTSLEISFPFRRRAFPPCSTS
jgi:bla regulator protein BlaR1